jgi:DnaJ-class molecular chaperone
MTPATLLAWAEELQTQNYYQVLRLGYRATPEEIQQAFHELSLRCHPDRFVDEGPEVAAAAAAVFKRAAEAYNVLRKPALKQRYDGQLRAALIAEHEAKQRAMQQGAAAAPSQPQVQQAAVRFDEHAVQQVKRVEVKTCVQIAQTPSGKQHAAKADLALQKKDYDKARIAMISACQAEPNNAELKQRYDQVYEAWMKS